jgi:hypothetical protein
MVDNSRYRPYRPNDPDRHEAAIASGVGHGDEDPLAELARLIGEDDVFAERSRAPAPRARRDHAPAGEFREAAQTSRWSSARWSGSEGIAQGRASDRTARQQESDDPDQDRYSYADGRAVYGTHGAQHDRYPSQPEHGAAAYDDYHYATAAQGAAPSYDTAVEEHSAYPTATQGGDGYESDPYYADDREVPPEGEEDYDAHQVPRRRRGLLIATVLGVAVAGIAGTFGYRAWTSDSGAASQPPTISADRSPVKLVPEAQSADVQQKKAIYDRVTDKGQASAERMVSRTEDPVDVTDATKATMPRAVFPGPEAGPAAPMATVPSPLNEPKKVKTQIIRPDNGMDTGGASSAPAPAAPAAATTAPSPPGPAAGPRRSGQRAPHPPASGTTPDQGDTGPTATARPTRTASATPAGETGYMVQVSSQRNEADASASYRALQAKYPSVLGDRQAVIRRIDLHEKGVFYRAMIGPFATAEEANQLCGSLKAAGGQCLVPKN